MNQRIGIRCRGSVRVWRECRFWMLMLVFFLLPFAFTPSPRAYSAEKWSGVDESVVEKYAKEHGREKREPFINTDQGDLLLFVFLLAGTVGGFLAGYSWRMLVSESGFAGLKDGQDYSSSSESTNPVNAGSSGLKDEPDFSLSRKSSNHVNPDSDKG